MLRLGLVAALWAALFGAFATARVRREISSYASHADQLRTVYQLELEREVAARREHTLTVERALRERADLSQRSEIVDLRAELAALRANLERMLGGSPLVERVTLRAESTRLLPLPAQPRKLDDSRDQVAAATVNRAPAAAMISTTHNPTGAGLRFGPGRSPTSAWAPAPSPAAISPAAISPAAIGGSNGEVPIGWVSHGGNGPGRHGVPRQDERGSNGTNGNGSHHNGSRHNGGATNGFPANVSPTNGSRHNGSHHNGSPTSGSHHNGDGARQAPGELPAGGTQRTVSDLLAAHGVAAVPRRRRSQSDTRSA